MPIGRAEFDQRRIDFRLHIMRVLEASPDEAFHTNELADLVSGWLALEVNREDFLVVLRELEAANRVEHTVIQGIHYWRCKWASEGARD